MIGYTLLAASRASLVDFVQSVNGRLVVALVLGTLGLWLLLPGPRRSIRALGALLAFAAATLFLTLVPPVGGDRQIPFSLLSGVTLVAAASAVTSRNPLYSAVWFAVLLLGTGGLFLLNGAQFLGVATVAVYAGAIVVTFLFVLMLAQPDGHAMYDRVGWGKFSQVVGCLTGMLVTAVIIWAVTEPGAITQSATTGPRILDNPEHVAAFGGQLFTRHLASVQAVGALLLAALVGAIAMASHGTERRRGVGPVASSGGVRSADDRTQGQAGDVDVAGANV